MDAKLAELEERVLAISSNGVFQNHRQPNSFRHTAPNPLPPQPLQPPPQQIPSQFPSPPHPLQPLPQQFPSPTASPPQPPQPDVRSMQDRSNEPGKICIWVKYRQYKLSALIDTGSDVSITSEDIAKRMGWEIHAPRTSTVNVANNNVMTITGIVRVTLKIDYRTYSEILISPDFEGLILGYD